jgi:hypothetical protein
MHYSAASPSQAVREDFGFKRLALSVFALYFKITILLPKISYCLFFHRSCSAFDMRELSALYVDDIWFRSDGSNCSDTTLESLPPESRSGSSAEDLCPSPPPLRGLHETVSDYHTYYTSSDTIQRLASVTMSLHHGIAAHFLLFITFC